MVERFLQAGDELVAVLSNGELVAAPLATLAWRRCGRWRWDRELFFGEGLPGLRTNPGSPGQVWP